MSLNRVVLVGRLTKNVDLRYTQNGKAVGNFTLAVNRPFKNASGENEADFILCQAWGKQAENLANYMKKGSQVGVDGRIATRSYDNNQGQRVFVTEAVADNVQFLESKGGQQSTQQQNTDNNTNQSQQSQQMPVSEGEQIDIDDSDLPF